MKPIKIPCAACSDMCKPAVELYNSYRLMESLGLKVNKAGIKCHKTGESFEVDFKQEGQ